MEVVTSLGRDEALGRFKAFFLGQGLEVAREDEDYVLLEGGGGFVEAAACPDGDTLRFSIFTREWEFQAKEFISRLPLI